jgi:hypothetical protein
LVLQHLLEDVFDVLQEESLVRALLLEAVPDQLLVLEAEELGEGVRSPIYLGGDVLLNEETVEPLVEEYGAFEVGREVVVDFQEVNDFLEDVAVLYILKDLGCEEVEGEW